MFLNLAQPSIYLSSLNVCQMKLFPYLCKKVSDMIKFLLYLVLLIAFCIWIEASWEGYIVIIPFFLWLFYTVDDMMSDRC